VEARLDVAEKTWKMDLHRAQLGRSEKKRLLLREKSMGVSFEDLRRAFDMGQEVNGCYGNIKYKFS
jgi:hypothetical protein